MNAQVFAQARPRLFHFTAAGAWSTLREHGLLTTACLLKRTCLDSEESRREIASRRQLGNISLEVPGLGTVIVRDQRPLNQAGLVKALPQGFEPQRWIDLLNARIFLWTRKQDCMKLVNATLCRGRGTLLELETSSLIDAYETYIELTTFNVGYALRKPKARSLESFVSFASYPSSELHTIRELTIKRSVKDLQRYVLAVKEWNESGSSTYTQIRLPHDGRGINLAAQAGDQV